MSVQNLSICLFFCTVPRPGRFPGYSSLGRIRDLGDFPKTDTLEMKVGSIQVKTKSF